MTTPENESNGTGENRKPVTEQKLNVSKAPAAKPSMPKTATTEKRPPATTGGIEPKFEVLHDGKVYGAGEPLPADISETDLEALRAAGAV